MAQQKNPNGFLPTRGTNLRALDRFFGYQAYRPTGAGLPAATALPWQSNVVSGYRLNTSGWLLSLFLVQCSIQTALLITNFTERSESLVASAEQTAAIRGALTPFANCKKRQSTQHDSDLLDSAANQLFSEFLPHLWRIL